MEIRGRLAPRAVLEEFFDRRPRTSDWPRDLNLAKKFARYSSHKDNNAFRKTLFEYLPALKNLSKNDLETKIEQLVNETYAALSNHILKLQIHDKVVIDHSQLHDNHFFFLKAVCEEYPLVYEVVNQR